MIYNQRILFTLGLMEGVEYNMAVLTKASSDHLRRLTSVTHKILWAETVSKLVFSLGGQQWQPFFSQYGFLFTLTMVLGTFKPVMVRIKCGGHLYYSVLKSHDQFVNLLSIL